MPRHVQGSAAPAPRRIGDAEDDPSHPAVDQHPGAHRTGLLGDVDVDVAHPPVAATSFQLTDDLEFGVGGDAVEEEITPIVENLCPFKGGVGALTTAILFKHVTDML